MSQASRPTERAVSQRPDERDRPSRLALSMSAAGPGSRL
jgi:hypothetical protein